MDSLGDRMKGYEAVFRPKLPNRLPVIIRVDGRAFHTFTRGFKRPFDEDLRSAMVTTALRLCGAISGAKFAYTQSDEISILVTNNDTLDTQAWFDNDLVKMCSIAASTATVEFNCAIAPEHRASRPMFDARAFVLPPEEVVNYFIWRQKDWHRNSLQMLSRSHYSHRELEGVDRAGMHEMLMEKSVNWADLPGYWKDGTCITRSEASGHLIDSFPPVFTKDREYIGKYVDLKEESDD